MEIKWSNVVVVAILAFAVAVIVAAPEQMRAFLGSMEGIAPGHSPEEQVKGLIAFGVVIASILAVAIIVSRGRNRD